MNRQAVVVSATNSATSGVAACHGTTLAGWRRYRRPQGWNRLAILCIGEGVRLREGLNWQANGGWVRPRPQPVNGGRLLIPRPTGRRRSCNYGSGVVPCLRLSNLA